MAMNYEAAGKLLELVGKCSRGELTVETALTEAFRAGTQSAPSAAPSDQAAAASPLDRMLERAADALFAAKRKAYVYPDGRALDSAVVERVRERALELERGAKWDQHERLFAAVFLGEGVELSPGAGRQLVLQSFALHRAMAELEVEIAPKVPAAVAALRGDR